MHFLSVFLSAATLFAAVSATQKASEHQSALPSVKGLGKDGDKKGAKHYPMDFFHAYQKYQKGSKSHTKTKGVHPTRSSSLSDGAIGGPMGTNPFGSNPTGTNPLGTCPLGSAYGCKPSASGTGYVYSNFSSLMHPTIPGKPTIAPTINPGSPPLLTATETETVVAPCPDCPPGDDQSQYGSPTGLPGGSPGEESGSPSPGESGSPGGGYGGGDDNSSADYYSDTAGASDFGGGSGGSPTDVPGSGGLPSGDYGGNSDAFPTPTDLGGDEGPTESGLGGMESGGIPGMSGEIGGPTNGCPEVNPQPPITVTETYSVTVTVTESGSGGEESGIGGEPSGIGGEPSGIGGEPSGIGGEESGGGGGDFPSPTGGGYYSQTAPYPVPGNSTVLSTGTLGTGTGTGTGFSRPTSGGTGGVYSMLFDPSPTDTTYRRRKGKARIR